jgi:hypothetical protein
VERGGAVDWVVRVKWSGVMHCVSGGGARLTVLGIAARWEGEASPDEGSKMIGRERS